MTYRKPASNRSRRALLALLALLATASAGAEGFATDGWPGEGIPILAATDDELLLHAEPTEASVVRSVRFQPGWRVVFDRSRYQTLAPVTLTVIRDMVVDECVNGPIRLAPGEEIEYLQYRAEGYGTVRVHGVICELSLADDDPPFTGPEGEPEVEWWVRVVDGDGRPLGWLRVDGGQARVIRRDF